MTDTKPRHYLLSLGLLGALYFIFGLVSWVNSILVPYFKISCELHSEVQGYLANFAFYVAYLVMSIPASWFLNRFGFKNGVRYGLWILAAGALVFVPAALVREYNLFLIGLFTMGTALAILQTAANPFVTIIGPIESATRRISVMGLCNKFAGIISPLVFSVLVISPSNKAIMDRVGAGLLDGPAKDAALNELVRGVIPPYIGLALILLVFGLLFYKSSIPDIDPSVTNKGPDTSASERKSILAYPYLVFGVIALLCHVGSQVISVNTIIGYAQDMGIDLLDAKFFPSATLACIMLGYTLGILLVPKVISQTTALKICTVTGLLLSFAVLFVHHPVGFFGMKTDLSIWFLVLMGIPNSLIYAGIWPLAIRNLGKWTNLGSSLLVMGLCGNAIMPLLYAWIADTTGSLLKGYWIMVPCFLFMIWYAFHGHRITHWKMQKPIADE